MDSTESQASLNGHCKLDQATSREKIFERYIQRQCDFCVPLRAYLKKKQRMR